MSDKDEMESSEHPLDIASKNRELDNMALSWDEYDMIDWEFHKFLAELSQNK